jgi:hypothetical protein
MQLRLQILKCVCFTNVGFIHKRVGAGAASKFLYPQLVIETHAIGQIRNFLEIQINIGYDHTKPVEGGIINTDNQWWAVSLTLLNSGGQCH